MTTLASTFRQSVRRCPVWAWAALFSLIGSAAVAAFFPPHVPQNHDEFANLLAGQTFARFQLTNPAPHLWRFFETPHVLVQPTYMAKYPPGPGLALAVGLWLGNPIFGVWLASALFAAAVAWMLQGFFPRRWALLGAGVVIVQLGLTQYWAQSFWGGALAGAGGALVFGATRRLWRTPRARDAVLLGLGAVLLMFTRPFEGLLACLVPGGVLAWRWCPRRSVGPGTLAKIALFGGGPVLAGGLFLAYYQFRVTGSAWLAPYVVYERQYSGAPLFIWQTPRPEPVFENRALRDFYRSYVEPMSRHFAPLPTVAFTRLRTTTGQFLGGLLAVAALLGLLWRPDRWRLLALAGVAAVSSALVVCYWFGLHYQAPAAALYVFLAIAGLRALFLALPRRGRRFGLCTVVLVAAHAPVFFAAQSEERRLDTLRASGPRQRALDTLLAAGGRHIVFVRLEPPYDPGFCWVNNDADLAASPVWWVWDRGPVENLGFLAAHPDRSAVLMTLRGPQLAFAAYPLAAPAP